MKFTHRPYVEQAQLMDNVLGLIDTDGLADEIVELTGPELLPILRLCQVRYERMVQGRAMRENDPIPDFRLQRSRLRRLIVRYAGAVMTMLDEDKPETLELVTDALMPMLTIRASSRPAESGPSLEPEDEVLESGDLAEDEPVADEPVADEPSTDADSDLS